MTGTEGTPTGSRGVAVVTGAASGLGAACARGLADEGYAVALMDRSEEGLLAVAGELEARGAATLALRVDVCNEDEVARAFAQLAGNGRLAVLVNSAGVSSLGTIEDTDVAEWDRILTVKLRGQFLTSKHSVALMRAGGGGAIVNVASMSGRTKSIFTTPAYAAANAGVIGLTMTTAAQEAKHGIRVNCVAPGIIETPMLSMYSGDQRAAMAGSVPLGRIASPSEVANVILFLLSEKASYITGETVNVNGGLFMV
jgi:3-oxoacyl-[acyl-carrier protein] reductase